jgi:hypothetical protein
MELPPAPAFNGQFSAHNMAHQPVKGRYYRYNGHSYVVDEPPGMNGLYYFRVLTDANPPVPVLDNGGAEMGGYEGSLAEARSSAVERIDAKLNGGVRHPEHFEKHQAHVHKRINSLRQHYTDGASQPTSELMERYYNEMIKPRDLAVEKFIKKNGNADDLKQYYEWADKQNERYEEIFNEKRAREESSSGRGSGCGRMVHKLMKGAGLSHLLVPRK